jgi:predicted secreted protein
LKSEQKIKIQNNFFLNLNKNSKSKQIWNLNKNSKSKQIWNLNKNSK